MTVEEAKQKAKNIVLTLLPDADDTSLTDNEDIFLLGLDSINAMTLVLNLQDEFNISFDATEINVENFRTISDITELVSKKQGGS
jgi:acyl carrier protein